MTAFALVENDIVQNVISCPNGVTPEGLGIEGDWYLVAEGEVGIGFVLDEESGEFTAPNPPVENLPEETP